MLQITPSAVARSMAEVGRSPVVAVPLKGKAPAPETVTIAFGPGFSNKAAIAQLLREIADWLASAPLDMEEPRS